MIGKLDPATLDCVLDRTGASSADLLTGAAYGEDAAAIDIGDDETLVVSADPISLAADRAGTLGVTVACNDVAASGADPEFLLNVLFLPEENDETLATLTNQLDAAANDLGVTIAGGHTEYVPALDRPLLSLTAFGRTDRYIPTGGAQPGDALLLTKGAAIEGTSILATDFADRAREAGVTQATLDRAAGFTADISITPEAKRLRSTATAMHDPTEGGVVTGAVELAAASGVDLVVERASVPIRGETATICDAVDVDPLRSFGSGALLAAVPPSAVDTALDALAGADIDAAVIGKVREPDTDRNNGNVDNGALRLDGERITTAPTDQLYPLWEDGA